jgi:uncharacterized damage-inducible protein DinB
MRKLLLSCGALLLSASPALAQADPMTQSIKGQFEMVKGYLTKTADQVSEENYTFKPTPEVRSLGAIIGHVADANFNICSLASGTPSPMKGSAEKTMTSKADLSKALKDSLAFCEAAFDGMTPAKGAEMVTLFGNKQTRLGALAFNVAHDFEHYGNLVTYMRLKGMVPPSSQGGGM